VGLLLEEKRRDEENISQFIQRLAMNEEEGA
jgi:hypothetical protein